ncbi:putative carboxylesterase 15 [Carex littledalei]|uniref:Putative carboxylesterase 15 n=1 Tax=Carex littledalei TaxID=544730 RepID=A0A833RT61_9POAL|nr:putative carboxylesterase 15 [Carex littledalei]
MVSTRVTYQPMTKKVVDEVSGWLRVFDDGSVDRTWTGPPEALPLMEPVPPYNISRDGITLHDLPGSPNLRLYLPESDVGKKLPILLHFQGGGFCISHHSWLMYHQFYARVACDVHAAVVSVELPLAPEHRLPAAIDTGFAALLRLRSIARFPANDLASEMLSDKVNFSRVFLIGDSSGGNLVHAIAAKALEERDKFWAPLKVAALYCKFVIWQLLLRVVWRMAMLVKFVCRYIVEL